MARNDFLGIGTERLGDDAITRLGVVESVDDEYEGQRIKVRLPQDKKDVLTKDLPYAFPLLPKTLHTLPKVGEVVVVLLSRIGNKGSIRFYIGPLISQPQYFYNETSFGYKSLTSLINGGEKKPLESISHYNETNGAFPKPNDTALVGRKSEDIILKDGEINIRCGIRSKQYIENAENIDSLQGDVIFNTQSPAYIQMKYERGLCKSNKQVADSVVNVVADKINLISHKDDEHFNLTDPNELIKKDEMDDIMSKLHQLPYGDILVEVLKKIIFALVNHVHAYPGLPPVETTEIKDVLGIDLEKILSENVRIS